MSPRRSRRTRKRRRAAAPERSGLPARLLLWGVLAGLALVLATPLAVTPGTVYPYVVGKAVYSRVVIEAVTALWAVLALARPDRRPPRSWLLVSVAASLAVSLLAAAAGVSFERSFWGSYPRMQGVIDDLHWSALLLVLVSTLRDAGTWRRFLKANLAVSSVVAGLAFARYFQLDVPFYGQYPEEFYPRIGGPLGNPAYLSGYLLAGAFVASGFAARALTPPRRGRRGSPGARSRRGAALRWSTVAALHFGGFALGGSVASWVALAAGTGFLCLAAFRLTRGRPRLAAAGALAVLAAGGAAAGWRATGGTMPGLALDAPVLRYVAGVHVDRPSSQARLGAWRAGFEGFTERPLLGWGPDNFHAPFNRFAEGYAAAAPAFDSAHNEVVEAAATAGILGLATWAATWCLAFTIVWRALGRLPPGSRALAVFIGAALAARLAQGQFWFDSAGLSLQYTLQLGFVAALLEPVAFPAARAPRLPEFLAGALRRRAAAVAATVVALGLAGAAAAAQRAIFAAANVQHLSPRPEGSAGIEEAIDGFPPMANVPRRLLFEDFGKRWRQLRSDPAGARRLLAWVDSEADAALAAEPEYWEVRSSLARMYREIAATEADYRDRAERHLRRARELAPNRPVFPTALTNPAPLTIPAAGGGRRELRWRPAEGAAYHEVAERSLGGRWRTLGWLYEPGADAFVAPAAASGGAPVYAVRACSAERCGKWMTWPSSRRQTQPRRRSPRPRGRPRSGTPATRRSRCPSP